MFFFDSLFNRLQLPSATEEDGQDPGGPSSLHSHQVLVKKQLEDFLSALTGRTVNCTKTEYHNKAFRELNI